MEFPEVANVVSIIVICYVIGMIAKNIQSIPDEWIPVIVCVSGGILGVVGMYVIPDYPAQDILNAIAVGIASGLASTGINQMYKQLSSLKEGTDSSPKL